MKTASARVVAVHERGIELDRTIFYPTGGGQLGDAGVLLRANGERIAIVDTLVALRGPMMIRGTFKAPVVGPAIGPVAARVGTAVGLGLVARKRETARAGESGAGPDATVALDYPSDLAMPK